MGLVFNYSFGQTPLEEDEKDGLLIPTISSLSELNEFEQRNIEDAIQLTLGRSFKPEVVFSEKFIRMLHKKMYADVWAWAGEFRKSNKNIGIDKWQIPSELHYLLDDARYWYENNTYPPDEIALRFKHRIVSIHCFANGNGRHSRLIADIIIEKIYKRPLFTWGAANTLKDYDIRSSYIRSLKSADLGEFSELLTFARS